MGTPPPWEVTEGDDPVVAAAIHNGHGLREEVAALMALGEGERLREEDPYTGLWTAIAATRVVVQRSRFEVDLNRPREKAVYLRPEDAWGLEVWKREPPEALIEGSLAQYDAFYEEAGRILSARAERFGSFVVLDLHSYNHLRGGPEGPPAEPEGNPEVNVGTGTMNRERWAPLVEQFIGSLRSFEFLGRGLEVGENVRFRGGQFPRWVHETFPQAGCCLAIEFKKFFMNEWTGEADTRQLEEIRRALESTLPGLRAELRGISKNA